MSKRSLGMTALLAVAVMLGLCLLVSIGAVVVGVGQPESARAVPRLVDAGVASPIAARPSVTPSPAKKPRANAEFMARIMAAQRKRVGSMPAHEVPANGDELSADYTGSLPKAYVQKQLREHVNPQWENCYGITSGFAQKLEGRFVVTFTIAAEPEIGGVVVESHINEERTDPHLLGTDLAECVQESVYAAEFDPPADGGMLLVHYPITFRHPESDYWKAHASRDHGNASGDGSTSGEARAGR